jgi:hypothetical protein
MSTCGENADFPESSVLYKSTREMLWNVFRLFNSSRLLLLSTQTRENPKSYVKIKK